MRVNERARPRARIDARFWPLLALGAMLGAGCTVNFSNFDARIVNESSRPLTLKYEGSTDDRDAEQWALRLAPRGEFERHLQGRVVRARAIVANPGGEPVVIEFSQGWSEVIVRDRGDGISVDQRAPRPKGAK